MSLRRSLLTTPTFFPSTSSRLIPAFIRPFTSSPSTLNRPTPPNKPNNSKMSSNKNDATYTDQAKSAAGIAAGHAQYAQGAATEAIGSATGSSDWQKSGADTKQAGADAIREAFNNAPGDGSGKGAELAEKACPQVGEGVGDSNSNSK